ncbi:MBOAT family O-acyltransferase [Cohnella cholangitidis]|uniref:MBOAT family protein n=1 Tax=Cohnella cholangitidis TaxID=2598458 RepID=A0A7G5C4D4_9BACL|nr:MBOAT family O-acyltransferase [Cohnella cholangitidis]QMV44068.1 MBOAT family protein [Cohnella cholangitidis]
MLFNSFEFILVFLPIVTFVYFLLNKKKLTIAARVWLVIGSLVFYSWWNLSYLPLILLSIVVNYGIGFILSHDHVKLPRKFILVIGLVFNISLLGYYKYSDFFITNTNALIGTNIPLLNIGLPLAISFFTFQQIAYIVDSYRKETREFDFINYVLFVTFFPQLIAGPIVHHKEMMPQFRILRNKFVNYRNQALGMFVFSIGLFKKVVLADTFAVWATQGFDQLDSLTFVEGWVVSLSYTFQLYFDFSGYMDMAMGAALLFNIKLPINFNSPYKALNIQDAWNTWHITLSKFLYRYIYIPLNKFLLNRIFTPLGLKKQVMARTCLGLVLLFLISGFWHGAGWTFVLFGLFHGIAMVIHRYWKLTKIKMNKILAWLITFNFINLNFVFFRATSMEDAFKVLRGMAGLNGIVVPTKLVEALPSLAQLNFLEFGGTPLNDVSSAFKYIFIGFVLVLGFKNSGQLMEKFKPTWYLLLYTVILFIYSLLNMTKVSEFLYFNF